MIQFRPLLRLESRSSRLPLRAAIRRASHPMRKRLSRIARTTAPALLALSVTALAHAQGTMDFSGAQTLMGTFNWRTDYVAVEQCSRNIVGNRYVCLVQLHQQHVQFANSWDANLALQGFAEAFTDKSIRG